MSKTAKFAGYFKLVNANPTPAELIDNVPFDAMSVGNITGWYSNIVTGSGNRISRYSEYDLMDSDIEVSRALDIIAEEIANGNGDDLLRIDAQEDALTETEHVTLKTALRRWKNSQGLDSKLFDIARQLAKYGDVFFNKEQAFSKWEHIPLKQVTGAWVDEDNISNVLGFAINEGYKLAKKSGYLGVKQDSITVKPVNKLVRFTLNDDMSDSAPFGKSVLAAVYKAYQQKKLVEDSIIIYRVQRAPEKRVFYIDVGRMPPNRRKAYLEQVKNEMRQRKIPSLNATTGEQDMDNMYDPQDMMEDFYLATGAEGKGSKIEVLPGGQNLGQLDDLNYFADKLNQGLRIPSSWTRDTTNGPAVKNNGNPGTALIQEVRFAKFIQRIQQRMIATLDVEFKAFLKNVGIRIDQEAFFIALPPPSDFEAYRQAAKDADLLNIFTQTTGIQQMSPRFAMKRFLQLTEAEVAENERALREEKGLKEDDPMLLMKLYQPEAAEAMGDAGGGGMGGGLDMGGDDLGLGGDEVPPDDAEEAPADEPAGDEPAGDEGGGPAPIV